MTTKETKKNIVKFFIKDPKTIKIASLATTSSIRNKWRSRASKGNTTKLPTTLASERGRHIGLMITGVLSYLSKQLANRTGDKAQQLQLSVRDLTSMLNSLEALAGKLSPVSTNVVGSNSTTNGQSTNSSSGLDTNANRVHPYLKQGSTSNNNNNNNNNQSR